MSEADRLLPDAGTLFGVLREFYISTAYDNRYTLHPRRLEQLAREESDLFGAWLRGADAAAVRERGRRLARDGFGVGPVARLAVELRGAMGGSRGGEDPVDLYGSLLLEGYLHAREEQILSDQEQLRRALSSALQQQSQELVKKNHAIDTSMNGIMLAELDGRVTYVNAAFRSLWGDAPKDDLRHARIGDFWASEEARQLFADLPRSGGWHGELAARRRDGSTFDVEVSASLIHDGTGRPIGIMSSFVDVTESKRLRSQVQQVQKMDALGQLAGGIAHDFNNLLTAISGYLQLLLTRVPRGGEMFQDLEQISAAVERGSGLTRQLRYFTRQATGSRQVMALNEAITETAELLRRTFPPEIRIQLRLEEGLWPIKADPNQISQVLMNLGVNGRDAMLEPGGARDRPRTLTFETCSMRLDDAGASRFVHGKPGRYVVLRVSDEGTGIPPELLEKLFIPFFTTKSTRSGTGLGLAVVYGIVRNHDGFIEVHSTVGRGTSFEVYLPASASRRARPAGEQAAPALARGSGTVLVVDDEPTVLALLTRTLESCGYTVLAAEHGEAALELYRRQSTAVSLVVLDMIMPVMGGRECLERLRAIDPEVRVLLITGYTTDGSAEELLRLGAVDLVEKPLDLRVFSEKVKRAIGRGRAPRAQSTYSKR